MANAFASSMKSIPNYEMYIITACGKVSRNGRVLKFQFNNRGYPVVDLCKGSIKKRFLVHNLVALVFLGPRPPGFVVRHLNGIKSDSRLENLKYGTVAENIADTKAHGYVFGAKIRGLNSVWAKLTISKQDKIKKLKSEGKSYRAIARKLKVHHKTVSNFINGVTYK